MADYAVTTFDNPHNPFTQQYEWLEFDRTHGYNTNAMIAMFSDVSSLMTDEEIEYETDLAVERFLDFNPYGIHYKFYETDSDELIKFLNQAYKQFNNT